MKIVGFVGRETCISLYFFVDLHNMSGRCTICLGAEALKKWSRTICRVKNRTICRVSVLYVWARTICLDKNRIGKPNFDFRLLQKNIFFILRARKKY